MHTICVPAGDIDSPAGGRETGLSETVSRVLTAGPAAATRWYGE